MPPPFDVLGIGLNATDTLILVPHFPAYAGKIGFEREILSPGGQVTGALVACAKLGLSTKYIGTVGDDERGRVQLDTLRMSGINVDDVQVRAGCPNQSAYILIDQSTGERTVFWNRDERLRLSPASFTREMISTTRLLHIDAHDIDAASLAAQFARQAGIPVTLDVDTIYKGFDRVLANVDYLIANSEFPTQGTGERDPLRALELIQNEYGIRVAAMTLGSHGALARAGGRFVYSPAFIVNCVDTTGAGDVFHGAFCYSVLRNMPLRDALEFSNAFAALNCKALGARGGIAGCKEAQALIECGERACHPDFASKEFGSF